MRVPSFFPHINCGLLSPFFSCSLTWIIYNGISPFLFTLAAVYTSLLSPSQHQLLFNFNHLQCEPLPYISYGLFSITWNLRLLFYPPILATAGLLFLPQFIFHYLQCTSPFFFFFSHISYDLPFFSLFCGLVSTIYNNRPFSPLFFLHKLWFTYFFLFPSLLLLLLILPAVYFQPYVTRASPPH